jgi:hypothetical protein
MTKKKSLLYLYLALACLLGIIIIFVFDGYLGVYDKLVLDTGNYKQTIEADQWARNEKYGNMVAVSTDPGGMIDFTYIVENHNFSKYVDNVDVSLWYNKNKLKDIISREAVTPSFEKTELSWSINATNILPSDYVVGREYLYNLKIKRGNMERDVNISVNTYSVNGKIIIPQAPSN